MPPRSLQSTLSYSPTPPTTYLHPNSTFGCCFETGSQVDRAGLKFSVQLGTIFLPLLSNAGILGVDQHTWMHR